MKIKKFKIIASIVMAFWLTIISIRSNVFASSPTYPVMPQVSTAVSTIYLPSDMSSILHIPFYDAPMVPVWNGNTYDWYNCYGDHNVNKFTGPVSDPAKTFDSGSNTVWNMNSFSGDVWISSIYKNPDNGHLLGFIHTENVAGPGGNGYCRVGLGYSKDNGAYWTYLGYIISPYFDWNGFTPGISGGPTIIKDGYFYTYFNEAPAMGDKGQLPLSVARAPVADVLTAAENGTVTTWQKYYNGAWTESGMGGNSTPVFYPGGTANSGFGWEMTYNTYINGYVFVYTDWGAYGTWMSISYDGLTWSAPTLLHKQTGGYFDYYCNIVPASGDSWTTGQTFYVQTAELNGSFWDKPTAYYDLITVTFDGNAIDAATAGSLPATSYSISSGVWQSFVEAQECSNSPGAYLEYNINVRTAGSYNLSVTDNYGSDHTAAQQIFVNGALVDSTVTQGSGTFVISKTVSFNKGTNVVRIQSNGPWTDFTQIAWNLVPTANCNTPIIGSAYKVVNLCSGKDMGVQNNSTDNMAAIDQYEWVGAPSQTWTLYDAGWSLFKFVNNGSGKALCVANNSMDNNGTCAQYDWIGAASQEWIIHPSDKAGYYFIENKNSGKYLGVSGNSADNGALLNQYDLGPFPSQYWSFVTP